MCYVDSKGNLSPLYLIEETGIQIIDTVPPPCGTPFRLIVKGSKFSLLQNTFTIDNPFNNFGSFQYEHIYYEGPTSIARYNVHDFINKSNKLWERFDTTNMPLHDNGSLINTAPQPIHGGSPIFYQNNKQILTNKGWIRSDSLDEVLGTIKVTEDQFLVKSKEPECHCKHLLDGHDAGCEYIKWKKSA